MKTAFTATVLIAALAACGSNSFNDDDPEFVGATAQAVSISTDQGIVMLNGQYTNCVSHTNGERWSAPVGAYAGSLPYPKLRVAKTDSACQLSLTDGRDTSASTAANAEGAGIFQASSMTTGPGSLTPTPIALGTAYGTAKPFTTSLGRTGDNNTARYSFFGTAKISATSFTSGFTITLLYSDNANEVAANIASKVSAVSGTATLERVPAPDYSIDVSTLNVYTALATPNVVESTEGDLVATVGVQAGEAYRIYNGSVGPTWGDVDWAYGQGTVPPGSTITGSPFSVPSTSLLAAGATLPATRTVIVRHDDSATGIPSYQFFTLTFN